MGISTSTSPNNPLSSFSAGSSLREIARTEVPLRSALGTDGSPARRDRRTVAQPERKGDTRGDRQDDNKDEIVATAQPIAATEQSSPASRKSNTFGDQSFSLQGLSGDRLRDAIQLALYPSIEAYVKHFARLGELIQENRLDGTWIAKAAINLRSAQVCVAREFGFLLPFLKPDQKQTVETCAPVSPVSEELKKTQEEDTFKGMATSATLFYGAVFTLKHLVTVLHGQLSSSPQTLSANDLTSASARLVRVIETLSQSGWINGFPSASGIPQRSASERGSSASKPSLTPSAAILKRSESPSDASVKAPHSETSEIQSAGALMRASFERTGTSNLGDATAKNTLLIQSVRIVFGELDAHRATFMRQPAEQRDPNLVGPWTRISAALDTFIKPGVLERCSEAKLMQLLTLARAAARDIGQNL